MENYLVPPSQANVPRVAFVCDISAAYLREAACDPSSVISAAKTAVASMLSAHPAAPLLLAEVSAAAAVPGAVAVRAVTIDGDPADLTSFGGSLPVLPNMIVVNVGSIN